MSGVQKGEGVGVVEVGVGFGVAMVCVSIPSYICGCWRCVEGGSWIGGGMGDTYNLLHVLAKLTPP